MIISKMDRNSVELKWMCNIPALYEQFKNIPFFDEGLRSDLKHVYTVIGGNSIMYEH